MALNCDCSLVLGTDVTKNTSKMTLYEVTSKVAKVNKTKAPRLEETPKKVKKTEKINKKPVLPAVMPVKIRRKNTLSSPYKRRLNLFTKPYVLITMAVVLILAFWITAARNNDPATENPLSGTDSTVPIPQGTPAGDIQGLVNEPSRKVSDPVLDIEAASPSEPVGDHVIILAHYIKMDQLLPVKAYFDQNGFQTVIDKSGMQYVLMTKKVYQNPGNEGSDGYAELQKLKLVGAKYKAPAGFLGFKFDDIYGKKN